FFIITDPAATDIYTLSLHDALPILWRTLPVDVAECAHLGHGRRAGRLRARHRPTRWHRGARRTMAGRGRGKVQAADPRTVRTPRSEEHTSELQSRENLVCRLLLEKK